MIINGALINMKNENGFGGNLQKIWFSVNAGASSFDQNLLMNIKGILVRRDDYGGRLYKVTFSVHDGNATC